MKAKKNLKAVGCRRTKQVQNAAKAGGMDAESCRDPLCEEGSEW
jgi:hypothetical protein